MLPAAACLPNQQTPFSPPHQAEAADDDDTAADNDTHAAHGRDQDQEISAAADGDESPSAAAAGDHISAHHESAADEAEEQQAVYGLPAGGSQGSEVYAAEGEAEQQEAGSYAEEQSVSVQQTNEIEEEEEYAPAEHDEQAKADQVRAGACRNACRNACRTVECLQESGCCSACAK
jgi:hypothetical protein